VPARAYPWILRALWVLVPVVVGPAISEALHGRSSPVGLVAGIGAWALWAAALVATLAPQVLGLTVFRTIAPGCAAAVIAAGVVGGASSAALAVAAAWAAVLVVVALLPRTGMMFVNGGAYANESRWPLRPPGAVLLGPLELAWAAVVAVPAVGALLLAARQWIVGGVVTPVGVVAVWVLGRALHGLSRRWAVLVPAGLVLHDPATLAQPVLFRRELIESLGPAPADSDSLDLTQGAPGLALELILTEKVEMSVGGEEGASARLLFTPTRPGALLSEAYRRNIRAPR
jgi:hypothetical protein